MCDGLPMAEGPFPQSLCHQCVHKRDVVTQTSTFLRCAEGSLPKYPPQPVSACVRFTAVPH